MSTITPGPWVHSLGFLLASLKDSDGFLFPKGNQQSQPTPPPTPPQLSSSLNPPTAPPQECPGPFLLKDTIKEGWLRRQRSCSHQPSHTSKGADQVRGGHPLSSSTLSAHAFGRMLFFNFLKRGLNQINSQPNVQCERVRPGLLELLFLLGFLFNLRFNETS